MKGPKKTFEEIIAKNLPNMGKEIVNHVQEAQSPRKDKPKEKNTETTVIKLTKTRDKILKAAGEKL